MYCCVIFGESKDNHTKNYLYKCKQNLKPGDIVKVLAKKSIKIALIKCIYEIIPQNIDVNLSKIKHVISKSNKVVDENMGKSFLLALIDEYKDGNITKEDLYAIMEHFISSSKLNVLDDEFTDIINHQLPDACSYYIDEPGSKEEKELGFWKELKDIEYKLVMDILFGPNLTMICILRLKKIQ